MSPGIDLGEDADASPGLFTWLVAVLQWSHRKGDAGARKVTMASANIFIADLDAESRVSFTGESTVALNVYGTKIAYRDDEALVAREQVSVFCTVEQARQMLTNLLYELEKGEG